jgi:hypothetical protein
MRRMAAELNLPPELAAQIAEDARTNLDALRASLESPDWIEQMAGDSGEAIHQLCFSADGRLLMCATDKGVRVYQWQQFIRPSEEGAEGSGSARPSRNMVPTPLFSVRGLAYREEGEHADDQQVFCDIFAMTYDGAGGRLLYGGMGGAIGCLDLDTGQAGALIELPGRPVVSQLCLSRDGSALACVTRPQFFRDDSARKLPPELIVWNYPALLKGYV